MRRISTFIAVPSLALIFSSCLTDLGEETHYIRFNDLQVGQESRYVRLHGYYLGDPTANIYVMVPDTLVVRVIGKDAQGFMLEDFLTLSSQRQLMPEDTAVYTYHLVVRNDTLVPQGKSHLFWTRYVWGVAATYPLRDVTTPQISVTGWRLSIDPVGQERGHAFATNVGINGHFYDRVNVYYWGFELDLFRELNPGEDYRCGGSFIFSAAYGMIRSKEVSYPELGQGLCWDLIW